MFGLSSGDKKGGGKDPAYEIIETNMPCPQPGPGFHTGGIEVIGPPPPIIIGTGGGTVPIEVIGPPPPTIIGQGGGYEEMDVGDVPMPTP
ncbi:MAG: hypothetical protein IH926_13450, partial [Proteobacteria bacterium]|nr:hypothetical protein [Pseudomonadota bacterium]